MNRSSNHKRIAGNTLMLYGRMLLVMLVSLYTSRIVLAELGVEDYGIFNVVGAVVSMLSFVNASMVQATQRFMAYDLGRKDPERLSRTFRNALFIHLCIGLLVLILAETIGLWFLNVEMNIPRQKMGAANWVFQCAVISYVLSIVRVPFISAMIARERMRTYAMLGVIDVGLKLLAALSLTLVPDGKLKAYALLMLAVSLGVTVIYVAHSRRSYPECRWGRPSDRVLFKDISGFAVWSLVGSLTDVLKWQGCNVLLNIFFGPAVNAAYGISVQVNGAVNGFVQNFTTALRPQIVKSYSSGDYEEMRRLMLEGSKFSFLLMSLLSFPLIMVADPLIHFWLVDVPDYAVGFTRLVIIDSVIESLAPCMSAAIQATGRIKRYQLVIGGTRLLNLPIALLCLLAGCGPTVVFVISIGVSLATIPERIAIMKSLIPEFSTGKIIRMVFLPAFAIMSIYGAIFIASGSLPALFFMHRIVPGTPVALAIGGLVSYTIGLNSTERTLICNLIKRRISA